MLKKGIWKSSIYLQLTKHRTAILKVSICNKKVPYPHSASLVKWHKLVKIKHCKAVNESLEFLKLILMVSLVKFLLKLLSNERISKRLREKYNSQAVARYQNLNHTIS